MQRAAAPSAPSAPSCSTSALQRDTRQATLDRARDVLQREGYAKTTRACYLRWIRRLLDRYAPRAPVTLSPDQVVGFLRELRDASTFSASSRHQAASAVVFFYKRIVTPTRHDILSALERHRRHPQPPPILTRAEVQRILDALAPPFDLIASLLYGSGLRLSEALDLRVGDIDLHRAQLTIAGKRTVPLARACATPLRRHLDRRRAVYERTLAPDTCFAPLPAHVPRDPLTDSPLTQRWRWQYVFIQPGPQTASDTTPLGVDRPVPARSVQRALHHASQGRLRRDLTATAQLLRHAFAAHALDAGLDLAHLQRLLGHRSSHSTARYAHTKRRAVQSRHNHMLGVTRSRSAHRR